MLQFLDTLKCYLAKKRKRFAKHDLQKLDPVFETWLKTLKRHTILSDVFDNMDEDAGHIAEMLELQIKQYGPDTTVGELLRMASPE